MPPVDGVQEQYLSWKADILFYLPSRQIHYLRDAIANAMMRMRKMKDKGTLVVISGFSGAGKGTVSKALVEKFGYSLSVSATTRQPREGEQDGREYYFKSEDDFLKTYEPIFIDIKHKLKELQYLIRRCIDYMYNLNNTTYISYKYIALYPPIYRDHHSILF